MQQGENAVLFSGQGAYYPGVLKESRDTHPETDEVFAEIDIAATEYLGTTVSEKLFAENLS